MYTEGHWWTDRVHSYSNELQRARLGGIAQIRSSLYPGHHVSWEFISPASYESVAILIPYASTKQMTIIAYNLEDAPVTAVMTGWDIDPGKWEVREGIDSNDDDMPDTITRKRTVAFERTGELTFTFPPKKTTVVQLKLKKNGKPYWKRPDLGIGEDDVTVKGTSVMVTVHSLGAVDAPASSAAVIDESGKTISTADVPALKAPLNYLPKTINVTLNIPAGTTIKGCRVKLNIDEKFSEITHRNNTVVIR